MPSSLIIDCNFVTTSFVEGNEVLTWRIGRDVALRPLGKQLLVKNIGHCAFRCKVKRGKRKSVAHAQHAKH